MILTSLLLTLSACLPTDLALLGLDQDTLRSVENPLYDALVPPGILGCYGNYSVTYRGDTGHFCPYAVTIVYVDTETFTGCAEGCGIWVQYQLSDWQGNLINQPYLLGAEGTCGSEIGSWGVLCPDGPHFFADVTLVCNSCEIIPEPL